MLRIVTDGAADIPQGWETEYDVQVIPINIQFGDKTFLQGVDLGNEDFYRLVEQSGTIPQTSQPSPYQFKEFYQRIAKPGDTILSIHVTSKLSGTYDSAVAAAKDLGDTYHIFPFDSASGSAAIGYMCREARLMDRAKATIQEILKRMEIIRDGTRIVLTLDTLEYARMSGRVGTLQTALASLLNVKPIVILHDGILEMTEKIRTRSRALERVFELNSTHFGQKPVNIAVVHARDPESAQVLLEKAKQVFNVRDLVVTELSISLVANFGPGTVGLIVYPAEE